MGKDQQSITAPKSVRITEIILGAITLIIAGLVFALPGFAAALLILWLSISLISAGFEGIFVGAGSRGMSGGQRALRIIAGGIAIGLSIAVLAFPPAALVSSLVLLSVGLMVLGASGIIKGVTEKYMSSWARAMYAIVGIITLGLSIAVVAYPAFGFITLYYFIAAVLIINGAEFVVAGITGTVYVPLGIRLAGGGRKTWESDAA